MKLLSVRFVLVLIVALTASPSFLRPQSRSTDSPVNAVEAEKWREDLQFLANLLPRQHKNLFHSMTKDDFVTAVNRLYERIAVLSRDQIIVEIARIGAMIGDGHSGVRPLRDPKLNFRFYPLRLYYFKDGIFVQAAEQSLSNIVGLRVVQIDETSIVEAYAGVAALVPRDNMMTLKNLAPFLLSQPEVLHALGYVGNMERARFTVEENGRREVVTIAPLPVGHTVGFGKNSGWIDMRDKAPAPTPLWLKDPENLFWFEYLADVKTLYVQFNAVANKPSADGKPGETVADFFRRVFRFVDSNSVDRFVLDLRMNGGGSTELAMPIIHGLIRSERINQKGKLFVVVGRRTFSAAQNLVNELEKHTNALFVGEPTGGRPNHYGDAVRTTLPNNGITFSASTLWHQEAGARDKRDWTAPHLAAEMGSEQYRGNIDPAMTVIMSIGSDPLEDLDQSLMEDVNKGLFSAAEQRVGELLRNPIFAYANVEPRINSLGYRLLNREEIKSAVEMFKLNVKMYPHSSNAYDSLGEAYLRAGEKKLALENYAKSLELDPSNGNAAEVLRRLREE